MKVITIIDAFISDNNQKKLLNDFLLKVNKVDPILLITNSILDETVTNKVDYLIYDKNNNLFKNTYDNYEYFLLWGIVDRFKLTTLRPHTQKHGLSVLINLFRSIKFAKELGYTHFRRIEYDMFLGEKTIQDFTNTPKECYNRKAKFFIDEKEKMNSFQYFFSEIDFFLSNFPEIKNEDDYVNLLKKEFNNLDFITVEKLMYHFIKKLNTNEVIIKDNLAKELSDSAWNQSSSNSHLLEQMKDCSTELYKQGEKNLIFTLNKQNKPLQRKVIIYYHNYNSDIFEYSVEKEGEWFLNDIKKNIAKIEIYDNNILVLEQQVTEIRNYIEVLYE